MRLPKNFQPVGTSKKGSFNFSATRSSAPLVGIDRAKPLIPSWKYGIASCAFAAIIATESDGVTKKLLPRIMFLSPSPSLAAPKSGPFSPYIRSTKSLAYVRLGSG
uniref:Uncharacterized protein n=1 Tax=Opuntia streptacantha TaxID=393608 RepID=A0A7C9CDK9_OPUST